jgi:hypothetical protein
MLRLFCIALLVITGQAYGYSFLATSARRQRQQQTATFLSSNSPPDEKWSSAGIDETAEKIESAKVAVVSLAAGGVATIPFSLIMGAFMHFSASWEFNTDGLALTLPLFGLVYRYACRADKNPQLKAVVRS